VEPQLGNPGRGGWFDDINSPHSIRGRRNRTMPGEMGENGLFLLLHLQRPFA
jgi:hypothetical protein